MFENPRRGRQARNFTTVTNAPKILDLKSSSEQMFSRKLPLGVACERRNGCFRSRWVPLSTASEEYAGPLTPHKFFITSARACETGPIRED